MMRQWIRTCQECGHRQKSNPPSLDRELPASYQDALCHKCRSPALDYGKWDDPQEDVEFS